MKTSPELNKRGVPVNANDWTEQDWLDLHRGMKRIIAKIAKRHRAAIATAAQTQKQEGAG